MFDLSSVNDVLVRVTSRGDSVVMLWQDADGAWKPITSNEVYGRVRALAEVFRGWGVAKGDRVAILSENRWEWAVTDLATLAIGGVDVPLYPTLTPEQIGYMLRDSGAKAAVLSSREQFEKLMAAGELPELKHVVVMDDGKFDGAECFAFADEGSAGEAAEGCGVRCDGEGSEAGGFDDDYLYVGDDRRAEGRDADAWEPGEQYQLLDGQDGVWGEG